MNAAAAAAAAAAGVRSGLRFIRDLACVFVGFFDGEWALDNIGEPPRHARRLSAR